MNYSLISFLTSFLMITLTTIAISITSFISMETSIDFFTLFKSAIIYLPAILFIISIAIFLIGFFPKMIVFPWFYSIYSLLIIYLGDMLQLPEWMSKISPFSYIPQLLIKENISATLFILIVLVLAISALGFVGYNKRDIQG